MYDLGDKDLENSYDPKKSGKKFARTPALPKTDLAITGLLKRVKKDRYPQAGNVYQFRFQVTKSNVDSVLEGAIYQTDFYPGGSDVDFEIFWSNVTPFLMAVKGEQNIGTFNAKEALGELKSICDGDENIELDLPFRMVRRMEEAKKDKKTGVYKANHLNADGTPKWFPRDEYVVAQAE